MSRNIPPVHSWRVRYWGANGTLLANVTIDTINKRFACWLARERLPAVLWDKRVTVSLVRKPNMCR